MNRIVFLLLIFTLFPRISFAQEKAAGWYLQQCKRLQKDVINLMRQARRCKTDHECFLTNEVSDRYTCCQFDVISRKAKIDPIKKKILEMENLNCPGPETCACEDWSRTNHDISCKLKVCTISHRKKAK